MKNNMTIQDQLNDLSERLNRIEAQLGTNHNSVADAQSPTRMKYANQWRSFIEPKPTEPDYSHLLPEGYEFCEEQDAEKWVKVKWNAGWLIGTIINVSDNFKMDMIMRKDVIEQYRPIRPIKHHVAVHEVVTAEKDPHQPDWTKAPEGTVAHAYDESKLGYWYTIIFNNSDTIFKQMSEPSNLRLPSGLDWKQSLRVNPNLK